MACKSVLAILAVYSCLGMAVCVNGQLSTTLQQNEICVFAPSPQISFVATTKKTALEAQPVTNARKGLEDILTSSKTFANAFHHPDVDPHEFPPQGTIVQSSRRNEEDDSVPAPRGLVSTIVEAYNHHHELVLRPDDVWQAVLTQFSFYVQAHAEELRDRIVDLHGKKQLLVIAGDTLFTADFTSMARRMVDEQILNNIKDPSIAEWLLPNFSTTTGNDRVVASVSVMATMQSYFSYKFGLRCGIPRVAMLGGPEDWRDLRTKVDRLPEFDLQGGEMSKWRNMLGPVLDNFVLSAEGQPDVSFWDRVASHEIGGSGPDYFNGWITVFTAFTNKGDWQGGKMQPEPEKVRDEVEDTGDTCGTMRSAPWPMIDTDDIAVASLAVPVLVDDNRVEYETQMLAGQFAFDVVGDGKAVQPRSDWCIAMPKKRRTVPMMLHGAMSQLFHRIEMHS